MPDHVSVVIPHETIHAMQQTSIDEMQEDLENRRLHVFDGYMAHPCLPHLPVKLCHEDGRLRCKHDLVCCKGIPSNTECDI
uniref:Uncharacterized protein n=1 Tax=Arundo donax TaxID=35708 RepID=A0A0A8Z729_ARUDO